MADPNIYQGPGAGGTHHAFVNMAAQGCDNTGGVDSAATQSAQWGLLAGSGQAAWYSRGTYLFATPESAPSGLQIRGGTEVTMNQQLAGGHPTPQTAWLYAVGTQRGTATGSIQTTPTYYVDNPTVVVNLATKPLVGGSLNFSSAGASKGGNQLYKVTAVAGGASPWTVTLNRPIVFPFVAGDVVVEYLGSGSNSIDVDGLALVGEGTGDQQWEFGYGNKIKVSRLHFDATTVAGAPTIAIGGFDVGLVSCVAEDCICDATGVPYGYYMQSGERNTFTRMRVKGATTGGIVLFDTFQCGIEDSWVYGGGSGGSGGLILGTLGAGFGGCIQSWIRGGGVVGNAGNGIAVLGSIDGLVDGASAIGCGGHGVYIGQTGTSKTSVCNVPSTYNSLTGFLVTSEAELKNIDFSYNAGGTSAAAFRSDPGSGKVVSVDGATCDLRSTDAANAMLNISGTLRAKNVRIASAVAGGKGIICTGGRVEADGCDVLMSNAGGAAAYEVDAGTMSIANAKSSTGAIYNVWVGATGTCNILGGCDLETIFFNVVAGGVLTMLQQGGVAAFAGNAGTVTMTATQHSCQSIEIGTTSPIASGAFTLNPLASFIGQQFVVKNSNTGTSTTTVFGIVVSVASTYLIRCNSAGVWEHDILT